MQGIFLTDQLGGRPFLNVRITDRWAALLVRACTSSKAVEVSSAELLARTKGPRVRRNDATECLNATRYNEGRNHMGERCDP